MILLPLKCGYPNSYPISNWPDIQKPNTLSAKYLIALVQRNCITSSSFIILLLLSHTGNMIMMDFISFLSVWISLYSLSASVFLSQLHRSHVLFVLHCTVLYCLLPDKIAEFKRIGAHSAFWNMQSGFAIFLRQLQKITFLVVQHPPSKKKFN